MVIPLEEWEAEQIAAYPHRKELIRTVGLAMRDFMDSEQVRRRKMCLKGPADGCRFLAGPPGARGQPAAGEQAGNNCL